RAGRGAAVRVEFAGSTGAAYRNREPGQHHFIPHSRARPDYPAVAIRTRRDKGNMPVAEKPAETGSNQNCGGSNAEGSLRFARPPSLEGTQPHARRYRKSHG